MITINFNSKIYPQKALDETIKTYSHLAKIQLIDKQNYFEIIFEDIDPEVKDDIKDEFCNYVLSLI